ncbi:MAG: metallophosphoesterase [Planctomycetota bacterium]|nr:MAG: metallophosphoesterase [Planctomycetota bacterium]REK23632.1 MAG: metallophosphoesterase [Planctomycetota bacterium]REK31141.1 MAG: metallophosphoesterase [Planctomycetota bacterium]
MTLAFFGGVYNNYLALEAAILDARRRGAERMFCLGDLGAFGPHPDRVFPLLIDNGVECIQGNYDNSIGKDLNDCQCGYTDPRDNYFAQISYEYTYESTSEPNRRWMRDLPGELRFEIDGVRFLLCHGSPRKTNEFLWESTTSTQFLEKLAREYDADVILGTHTGIHWVRQWRAESGELNDGSAGGQGVFVNVGVLGRPENDGRTNVWYTLLRLGGGSEFGSRNGEVGVSRVEVEFVPLEYDHNRLAREMAEVGLPEEFIETIQTGWWTTCLEILPGKERRKGRF